MNYFFSCLFFLSFNSAFAQDSWSGNTTPSYPELINYLKKVAQENNEIELYAMGPSDYGLPIYICIINGSGDSLKTLKKAREESTILINNAIHPGEPDGVNAMLIWIDTWIKNGKNTSDITLIAFIPAYNVGGMMNRSSTSRANQNGPEEYGFRGNAKNLDLIILNSLNDEGAGFGTDTNKITFISHTETTELPLKLKTDLAKDIVKKIKEFVHA